MPRARNNAWASLLIIWTICAAMPSWKRLGVCAHRGWNLPARIMNDYKAYASRHLNRMGLEGPGRKRWARHGSTRWLWKHIVAAIQ